MNLTTDAHRYDDIIEAERPALPLYPDFTAEERAAQFSPFAALNGHSEAIAETARYTEERIVLDEDAMLELDAVCQRIQQDIDEKPEVEITYFKPDDKKKGGSYRTVRERVVRMDAFRKMLVLIGGEQIPLGDVIALRYRSDLEENSGISVFSR